MTRHFSFRDSKFIEAEGIRRGRDSFNPDEAHNMGVGLLEAWHTAKLMTDSARSLGFDSPDARIYSEADGFNVEVIASQGHPPIPPTVTIHPSFDDDEGWTEVHGEDAGPLDLAPGPIALGPGSGE